MTEYVVNDALAVTQYLTQHLNESRAIAYLASIAGLTLDDWKDAKTLLDTVEKTRRHTKEANIKDIVTVFFNTCVETQFVLKNLSLIPNWGLEFIELANYTASAVEVAKQFRHALLHPILCVLMNIIYYLLTKQFTATNR